MFIDKVEQKPLNKLRHFVSKNKTLLNSFLDTNIFLKFTEYHCYKENYYKLLVCLQVLLLFFPVVFKIINPESFINYGVQKYQLKSITLKQTVGLIGSAPLGTKINLHAQK